MVGQGGFETVFGTMVGSIVKCNCTAHVAQTSAQQKVVKVSDLTLEQFEYKYRLTSSLDLCAIDEHHV